MPSAVLFTLVVGVGSTIVLDVWARFLRRWFGIPGANWGIVGRWLLGLAAGKPVYRGENVQAPNLGERVLGWTFHYLVGIAYAAFYPLIWGAGFMASPSPGPVLLIGLGLSTLAGMAILTPGLGGGFFAAKAPDQGRRIALSLLNHSVFAAGQYFIALGLVTG